MTLMLVVAYTARCWYSNNMDKGTALTLGRAFQRNPGRFVLHEIKSKYH
jgi:hypothetical protein